MATHLHGPAVPTCPFAKIAAAGKRFGRPAIAGQKADEDQQLRKQGMGVTDIARQLGVSRASVYCSLDNGTPVDSFKKRFNALLEAAGFVYINKRDKHAP
ncbi:MAG: helix-turn-helix domain-containing protein [Anderseniella sp.]